MLASRCFGYRIYGEAYASKRVLITWSDLDIYLGAVLSSYIVSTLQQHHMKPAGSAKISLLGISAYERLCHMHPCVFSFPCEST